MRAVPFDELHGAARDRPLDLAEPSPERAQRDERAVVGVAVARLRGLDVACPTGTIGEHPEEVLTPKRQLGRPVADEHIVTPDVEPSLVSVVDVRARRRMEARHERRRARQVGRRGHAPPYRCRCETLPCLGSRRSTPTTPPDCSKEAYDWQAERLGEPTEFTMIGSLYPEIVMERLRLYRAVEGCPSALAAGERQLAAYVASMLNGTGHCASGLRVKLPTLGVDEATIDAVTRTPRTSRPETSASTRSSATRHGFRSSRSR